MSVFVHRPMNWALVSGYFKQGMATPTQRTHITGRCPADPCDPNGLY
jgi:hypothetical protein